MTLTIMFQVLSVLLIIQCCLSRAQNFTTESTPMNMTTEIVDDANATISASSTDENSFVPMNIDHEPLTSLMCEKRDKPYFIPHTTDASRFYVCVKGQLFLLNCPSNYRFDSGADQCLRQSIKDHVNDEKPKKPLLIAHETNCGWYYIVRPENAHERVLNSCPMPQLFDIPSLQCRNYTEVKCKARFEPKDACDYQIRSSAHAYPCAYMPSCKNRPDGLYADRLRDCRMYFRCTSERSSESYSCAQDTLPLGERFSFEEQRCLPAQYVECINDEQKPF